MLVQLLAGASPRRPLGHGVRVQGQALQKLMQRRRRERRGCGASLRPSSTRWQPPPIRQRFAGRALTESPPQRPGPALAAQRRRLSEYRSQRQAQAPTRRWQHPPPLLPVVLVEAAPAVAGDVEGAGRLRPRVAFPAA